MDANPYAPPKAAVADQASDAPIGLKRRRVVVMILFLVITLGLYYVIWFFRRRDGLNRLNSTRKLPLWPLVTYLTLFMVEVVVGFATGSGRTEDVIGDGGALLLRVVQLAVGILMIVQCFAVKDIIEDHLFVPADDGTPMLTHPVKLSGLMTFFFSIFYLQWAINKYIIGPGNAAA